MYYQAQVLIILLCHMRVNQNIINEYLDELVPECPHSGGGSYQQGLEKDSSETRMEGVIQCATQAYTS
jgi:hypothetical protein